MEFQPAKYTTKKVISPKFLYVLRSLKTEDIRDLGRFLKSPVHNKNKNIIRVFEYLKPLSPLFDSGKLGLESIHKKLFPGKKYNEKVMRNLVYEFVARTEDYFSFINYENDDFAKKKHLLKETLSRNLSKLVNENLEKTECLLSIQQIRDDNYYSNKAFLEKLRYEHEALRTPIGKSLALSNIKSEYIKDISNSFILITLKEILEKTNSESKFKTGVDLKFGKYVMEYLDCELEDYINDPIIYIFFKFIKLNPETPEKQLYDLKDMLLSNRENISHEYYREFVLILYNYCKEKERLGQRKFADESLGLARYIVSNKLLLEVDNTVLEQNYTNTAATFIRHNELASALEFIESYKKYLRDDVRENAYCYNNAAVCFRMGCDGQGTERNKNFEKATEYLSKVRTEDFFRTTRINNLKLLIFYENNDFEPAYSLIDTYRHFLRANRVMPDGLKRRYSNFTGFVNRLLNLKSDTGNTDVAKLRQDIETGETDYKHWLISKLEELERRGKRAAKKPAV